MVLLEAMAAGLPVITHRAGGIPDIFTDGRNGVLLDQSDDDTVTDALRRLLDDREGRAKVAEQNREDAWAHYEAHVVTQRMLEVYRELV